MAFGFRYLLVLQDGSPADPAEFNTAVPTWQVGDVIEGGQGQPRFRVVALSDDAPPPETDGVLVVQAVEN